MHFKLKQCLVGIATISSLAPVAAFAQTSAGQYIFDGFSRATRDGQGSTCVSAGGPTHAFDSADCTNAAAEAAQKRSEVFTARAAAKEEAMAQAAAAKAAAGDPLGTDSTGVV
ncbi:MAG: hypothetical protein MUF30_03785, partial [Burkholderiales bacterium]|nr:hypothetical protein [Burkholderiales bacterium]